MVFVKPFTVVEHPPSSLEMASKNLNQNLRTPLGDPAFKGFLGWRRKPGRLLLSFQGKCTIPR